MSKFDNVIPDHLKTPYKLNRYLLQGSGKEGDPEREIDCPFVFSFEGKYGMTYVGFDGVGYRTFLAFSEDLINWERYGVIIDRIPGDFYLSNSIAMTWILRDNDLSASGSLKKVNGEYVGAYFATPGKGYEAGPGVIGLCHSKDLFHWVVDPPCLFPEEGAMWEQGGLYKACLVEEEGKYYLYYNAKNKTEESSETTEVVFETAFTWREQIGVAISDDLVKWRRFPGNPIVPNGKEGSPDEIVAGDACVIKNNDEWLMFYYCFDGQKKTFNCVARSKDLISFQKYDGILLAAGEKGSIDETMAFKPSVIKKDGILYHFYTGISLPNKRNGITFESSVPVR